MVDKKGNYRELPSVTTLSPEECIERLQKLGEYGIRVNAKRENERLYLFDAEQWQNNCLTAAANGGLTRWEGTSTHIQLGQKLTHKQQQRINRLRWIIPLLMVILGVTTGILSGIDARSTVILAGILFLLALIPGVFLKQLWVSHESDDLLWILANALNGKPLSPEAQVRSLEEIGLQDELKRMKS
jgi:hypothetical protein